MPTLNRRDFIRLADIHCRIIVQLRYIIDVHPGVGQLAGHRRQGARVRIVLDEEPRDALHRPSADVLMASAAAAYGARTVGVVLTGMGSDGTKGLGVLKDKEAYIIGQDEASCIVYGMPKAPAELGYLDVVVPLGKIADEIVKSIK